MKKRITSYAVWVFVLALIDLYVVGLISALIGTGMLSTNGWQDQFVQEYVQQPFHTIGYILNGETNGSDRAREVFVRFQIPYLVISVWFLVRISRKTENNKVENASEYGSHGTARWATRKEIETNLVQPSIENKPGLYLGQLGKHDAIHPKESDLNQNLVVFGASGARKSRAFVVPNIKRAADQGESIVVTDTKGTVYNQTSEYLKQQGYEVYVLNYLDPTRSHCKNPFDQVNSVSDVMRIANMILSNTKNANSSSDEMWTNAEEAYLKTVILYLMRERPQEEFHMAAILELGVWGANNQEAFAKLIDALPNGHDAKKMFNIFRIAKPETRAGILIGFSTRLQLFIDPGLAFMWSRSDFNLHDLGKRKIALFILIRDRDKTYAMPIALTFAQLFNDLYEEAERSNGELPIHVRIFMDEFANIGKIPEFGQIASTNRSRGIHVVPIIQSLSQIYKKYGQEEGDEILGNMDTFVFLSTNDLRTAKYLSERIGKTTLIVQSVTSKEDQPGTKNSSYTGRSLINPDELISWERSKLIVMQNGRYPAVIEKVDFSLLGYNLPLVNWTDMAPNQNLSVPIFDVQNINVVTIY